LLAPLLALLKFIRKIFSDALHFPLTILGKKMPKYPLPSGGLHRVKVGLQLDHLKGLEPIKVSSGKSLDDLIRLAIANFLENWQVNNR
jgi:hypothetical protein